MGAEKHAYGTSLFCIGRRQFMMGFSTLMMVMCWVRIIQWLVKTGFSLSSSELDLSQRSCIGEDCYQVFSCYGMKDTTYHVVEPLLTLAGVLFYPLGLNAAANAHDLDMKRFGLFLLAVSAIHIATLIGDVVYFNSCDAYSTRMIELALGEQLLPPTILRPSAQTTLKKWNVFPTQATDDVTQRPHLAEMCFAFYGVWAAFLFYAAIEAMQLSHLLEHGLLGLGVHFGLDQWDEVLNRDAIQHKIVREMRSKFVDDAQLPLVNDLHVEKMGGYGSAAEHPWRGVPQAQEKREMDQFGSTMSTQAETGRFYSENEEEEAEAVRQLAERLAAEADDTPEAILDRTFA
eukprot:TRINITY_DN108873_c0_g1_i1.p1 TRINITY_DN108873_c0_g1~~TRINITY_DN108873_c0_g1_i1.p1  ORF type:complete len:345 (-),score=77.13 TRINITY_DN108873_c0_g1_i1:49-1083(-)